MSLVHAENFNIYGTDYNFMLNGRYTEVSPGFGGGIVSDPDGVSTPKVFRGNGGDQAHFRRSLLTPTNKVGIGNRLWCSNLPSDPTMNALMPSWRDASNNVMMYAWVETSGAISARCRDNVGVIRTIYTTPGPVIGANAWWHLEAAFDASAKTFELRVEGVPVITLIAADFAAVTFSSTNVTQCGHYSEQTVTGGGITSFVKDLFWWDGLGSRNNSFLGSCIVTDLTPVSDITLGGWTPSTGGAAWSILNQQVPGTTPYVAAAYPVPVAMQMNMSDLPTNVTSVKGLITCIRAAKIDGGDGQLQVSTLSGAATGAGANRPITAAQTYWEDVSELDPNTSAQWTPVGVNNMGLKVDRTL